MVCITQRCTVKKKKVPDYFRLLDSNKILYDSEQDGGKSKIFPSQKKGGII